MPITREDVVAYYEHEASRNRHLQVTSKNITDGMRYSDRYHTALRQAEHWRTYEPPEEYVVYPEYDAEGNVIRKPLSDGFYWFTSERSSGPTICQYMKGGWYPLNETGPLTLEELKQRGWDLGDRIEEDAND